MHNQDYLDGFDNYGEGWPGVYTPPSIKTVKIIEELQRREKYTPDFVKLKHYENILVFVYDEMMSTGKESYVLSESKFLGKAVSSHNLYQLRGHRIPVLLPNEMKSSPSRGKIKGELYAVPPETLLSIDKLKRNHSVFKREHRTFFLTDQKYKTKKGQQIPSVKAWVYMGLGDVWSSDHLPLMPQYYYAGSKDRKYYEFKPDIFKSDLDRMVG